MGAGWSRAERSVVKRLLDVVEAVRALLLLQPVHTVTTKRTHAVDNESLSPTPIRCCCRRSEWPWMRMACATRARHVWQSAIVLSCKLIPQRVHFDLEQMEMLQQNLNGTEHSQ